MNDQERERIIRAHLNERFGRESRWPPVRNLLWILVVGVLITVVAIVASAESASVAILAVASGVLGGLITGGAFIFWEITMGTWVRREAQDIARLLSTAEEE